MEDPNSIDIDKLKQYHEGLPHYEDKDFESLRNMYIADQEERAMWGLVVCRDIEREPMVKDILDRRLSDLKEDSQLMRFAWLLNQHMDNDPEYQKRLLPHLEEESDDWKKLYDRIQLNSGKPQKYNTHTIEGWKEPKI